MGVETQGDRFAALWDTHRAYVVDLAFRMLGDIAEAEDVAQEAFLRLSRARTGELDNVRGWLTVVTGRLCLDMMNSARTRHERPGAAELLNSAVSPDLDPADRVTLDDHVQSALAMVLQRLNPPERVAFILHDVFALPFEEIAAILGRPVGTCRQLARRARTKITRAAAGPPAGTADRAAIGADLGIDAVDRAAASTQRVVLDRFIAACSGGGLDALLTVLAPDAWGSATFVGGSLPTPQDTHSATAVASNLLRYFGSGTTLVSHPAPATVAVLAYRDRLLYGMLVLTVRGDRVAGIEAIVDPTIAIA
ncbi:sigma-70 family RNA polymerase sigma factor [Nocardia vaccinii]|uniref:sigma-70 family RNA polymerase sigma factor n=1 Tax=Nocardia vaccinii TaxID=1822 RepID=UPI00082B589C|nr:sigma-70 family RNA polymerase sigma factor [Nocardia vaccinii]